MNKKFHKALRWMRGRSGQSLTEYAVILSFVAMVAVLVLRQIGTTTSNSMTPVNNALQ
jgi:Flp pilus assembly pilin Flp